MSGRLITTHQINGLNEALTIHAVDEPGHGGAAHRYKITGPMKYWGANAGYAPQVQCDIKFQKGPITEDEDGTFVGGVNGVSNEALLAVVEDRLRGFQEGPFACDENGLALQSVRNALTLLQQRTRDRTARGVEGTNQL